MTERPAARTTAELSICLLGPPRVELAGRALPIARRQARALLYRLAIHLQPVPREQLCGLFWPDVPESVARRDLSRLLTHLRRALPAPEVLLTTEDHVGLDPCRAWSDTTTFEELWARWQSQRQATALQQAVGLVRGPFLAGFSLPDNPEFETWAALERERWERLYLEALSASLEEAIASGDYAAAIACAQSYLATDDLAEDIHRRLIELYAAVGDRSTALRQFERCVAVLERELGVDPLPETQAVYRSVLAGGAYDLASAAPLARPAWATLPGLDAPLVGREGALRQLERAYVRAQTGHGQMVLISGEPGVGKSRLMQEFATHQHSQVLILAGAGSPDAQTLPYQPLVQALRCSSALWPACPLAPAWLAEVSRLLPELHSLRPDLPALPPTESAEARARLFEALCRLILSLTAGARPVLLCLDDLHWADSATLDWLAYLGRRLHTAQLLVIGAYRSEEAAAVAELRHCLARCGVLSEVSLEGLDEAAVLLLLRHLTALPPPPPLLSQRERGEVPDDEALAGRLQQATGGNPFFLLETLRTLFESGWQPQEQPGPTELPLPDSVRQAVEGRIDRLSSQARQVLEAGAVLGQAFAFAAVRATAGRRTMEAVDGLDELVARQLLLEQPAGYRFRHDIVREAVYQALSHQRKRLLHRRAGQALERLQPDEATALAYHFERAGEPLRAARYALQAGLAAKAVFAHVEARACFDRVLALLEPETALRREAEALAANRRLRIQALYERGWALRLLGDMEAYERDLQEVARLAQLLGDPHTLAHLRWREAYTHRWFCRYAEARQAAEEGLCLAQASADLFLEGLCWREVGMAARATGDYAQARAALERALALFVEVHEVVYELHALGNLSTLYWYVGEHERAMDMARRALARCDAAGLPLERRLPLGDMGVAAAALGDGGLARRCLSESLAIARQIADRTQEILCLGHLGWLGVQERQLSEALDCLRAALALAESIDSRTEQSWLHSGLAEVYRLGGDREQAETHARRALELAQRYGRAYDEALARRILEGPEQDYGCGGSTVQ